jgi:DNA-binding Lrp family transcriptional regulator
MQQSISPMFSGVFIPREIIVNGKLSSTDKLIFGLIQGLDNEKGCYASNAYIGDVIGVGAETVRASVARLEELGLIVRYFVGTKDVERTIKTVTTIALTPPNNLWGTPQTPKGAPPEESGVNSNRDINRDKYNKVLVVNVNKDSHIEAIKKNHKMPHSEKFAQAYEKWVQYRVERKKPLTKSSVEAQLLTCSQHTEEMCIESINKSIERGWLGLFIDSNNGTFTRAGRKPLKSSDHNAF